MNHGQPTICLETNKNILKWLVKKETETLSELYNQFFCLLSIKQNIVSVIKLHDECNSENNLKLFSIRVKELFEPIVWNKRRRVLALLKAFSWETDLWVMLGDFTVKKNAKLGRQICIRLKIDWVEMKIGVRQIMDHIMCKRILDSNLN